MSSVKLWNLCLQEICLRISRRHRFRYYFQRIFSNFLNGSHWCSFFDCNCNSLQQRWSSYCCMHSSQTLSGKQTNTTWIRELYGIWSQSSYGYYKWSIKSLPNSQGMFLNFYYALRNPLIISESYTAKMRLCRWDKGVSWQQLASYRISEYG